MPSPYALPGRPRSAGRLARSPALSAALAARLTARDRWLLRMICEHRVLTTGQITQLAFGTTRAATARMTTLYQYRAVDRFRPLAPAGSSPLHFVLDEAGAMLVAAEDGITPADLGYRRDRAMAVALSPRLAHDVGANGIFTALAAAARASGGQAELECWWSERRCAAAWGDHARPDGYGRWREQTPGQPPAVTDFFLEYDTGTENLPRLIAKLAGYRDLAARTGIATPVLFWLPSPRREAALRARLRRPAAARHPQRPFCGADPRRPRRHRRPRHQPRRPGRSSLDARRQPRAAAAARPARPARHRPGRQQPGRRDARCPARRPGLAAALPRPARLARPVRRAPPRAARR